MQTPNHLGLNHGLALDVPHSCSSLSPRLFPRHPGVRSRDPAPRSIPAHRRHPVDPTTPNSSIPSIPSIPRSASVCRTRSQRRGPPPLTTPQSGAPITDAKIPMYRYVKTRDDRRSSPRTTPHPADRSLPGANPNHAARASQPRLLQLHLGHGLCPGRHGGKCGWWSGTTSRT